VACATGFASSMNGDVLVIREVWTRRQDPALLCLKKGIQEHACALPWFTVNPVEK